MEGENMDMRGRCWLKVITEVENGGFQVNQKKNNERRNGEEDMGVRQGPYGPYQYGPGVGLMLLW